ncbi:integrating conjugative element protein [uncultured Pseudoteredinibacter sp.]|uniref:integrating conjugative element protein n=1 Tax=uncultured Pseudoteredinibacter sp. TaxID=1641701 RepID=UPI00262F13CE|nr:integrating conjugative element protein [uncultured Pseudoteredinibacter sp.]
MSKNIKMLIVPALVFSIMSHAQQAPTEDSLFYYEIGGGRNVTLPPGLEITTIDLSFSAQANMLSCSGFDPTVAIKHSLDNLKNGVDDAINAVESAATAAIANLPGYILQKANPGLYDLFQNALLRANESLKIATKSCERVQYEISNNTNPFDEWITISWGDSWKHTLGAGGENIHDAVEAAERAPENGIRWIGGEKRGGQGQPPIRVIGDVSIAGLNTLSKRSPTDNSSLPNNSALKPHFSNPEELRTWIEGVLGEVEVGLCDSCSKAARPGKGLLPKVESLADELANNISDLISGTSVPNRQALEHVSAPGITFTLQVIEAVRSLSREEQSIVTQKLAQDVAEARVLEQAMVVRRLLLSGRKEGNVAANKLAQREVDHALSELDGEIRNVLFEKEVREKLVNQTIIQVLKQDRAKRLSSISRPSNANREDQKPLRHGAVER